MVSFEADRLKEVSALKDKTKSLETEKAQACTSLSQLGLEQDKMKKELVFLQHVLQARESELKNRQGKVFLISASNWLSNVGNTLLCHLTDRINQLESDASTYKSERDDAVREKNEMSSSCQAQLAAEKQKHDAELRQ
jgi:chromosome segregation ATPase